jgi:small subunit ribosomal protein S8
MTDPISDMMIRIKNAGISRKEFVSFPYSNLKFEICSLLQKEGYLASVDKKGKKVSRTVEVGLLYGGNQPKIKEVKRVSKPSRRIYKKAKEIRPVKRGYGIVVLSTPAGIMSGSAARKASLGGEVLFEIW